MASGEPRSESLDFLATPPALPPRRTERYATAPIYAAVAAPKPLALPLWASIVIGLTYGMLAAATALGVHFYVAALSSAEAAIQQGAIGARHAAQFNAAYILARCVEKIVRAFAQR